MGKRRDRAGCKLPLKTEHDVGENHDQDENHCQSALLGQLITNLSANELNSPEIHVGVIRGQYFTQ